MTPQSKKKELDQRVPHLKLNEMGDVDKQSRTIEKPRSGLTSCSLSKDESETIMTPIHVNSSSVKRK